MNTHYRHPSDEDEALCRDPMPVFFSEDTDEVDCPECLARLEVKMGGGWPHHDESEDCWCCPTVHREEDGIVVVHNEKDGAN